MHQAILSVGSNINAHEKCRQAEAILAAEHQLFARSSYIVTRPDGDPNQDDYLNGAYFVGTDLSYPEFNEYLKDVERRLGRVKGTGKDRPHPMDLDIIFWDGEVVHASFPSKDYVRVPVLEILERCRVAT